jgi:anti-sigma regulatory factor (Ser/Thr protein kinase)
MPSGGSADRRWPLVSVLELDATDEAPGGARRHLTAVLAAWALPRGLAGEAEMICSELMTNAVQATSKLTEERPVALRLLANAERLVLEVWDCHPGVPVRRVAEDDAVSGRGLAIVAELSNRWGTRRLSQHVKAVWAELLLSPAQASPVPLARAPGRARDEEEAVPGMPYGVLPRPGARPITE